MSAHEQIAQLLARITKAWREGQLGTLDQIFHDGIVMAYPGFSVRAEGKVAVIGSYEEFCSNATVQLYVERDLQIDVQGDTAIASYAFEMAYTRDGKSYKSTGRDLFVFAREDAVWLAIWRTLLDVAERPLVSG